MPTARSLVSLVVMTALPEVNPQGLMVLAKSVRFRAGLRLAEALLELASA